MIKLFSPNKYTKFWVIYCPREDSDGDFWMCVCLYYLTITNVSSVVLPKSNFPVARTCRLLRLIIEWLDKTMSVHQTNTNTMHLYVTSSLYQLTDDNCILFKFIIWILNREINIKMWKSQHFQSFVATGEYFTKKLIFCQGPRQQLSFFAEEIFGIF